MGAGPDHPDGGPERRVAPSRAVTLGLAVVAAAALGGLLAVGIERATEDGRAPTTTVTAPASAGGAGADGEAAAGWTDVAGRVVPGVVTITATVPASATPPGAPAPPGGQEQAVSGSGFVLDRSGHVVTAQHVVADATAVTVRLADGTSLPARLVGADATTDLAVVRVSAPAARLHPLTVGGAEALAVGQPVLAVGTPFGYPGSATAGIVSGLGREIESPNGFTLTDAVQTDAPVNHGNSGGPLVDRRGRVLAVNVQIADSGVDANVGLAFAVPLDAGNRKVVASLRDEGRASHAWLGLAGVSVEGALAASGLVPARTGILVVGIVSGSPADRAGLSAGGETVTLDGVAYCVGGDVITAVDGRRVGSMGDLQDVLESRAPGERLTLTVVRPGGAREQAAVTLEQQPAQAPALTEGCPAVP